MVKDGRDTAPAKQPAKDGDTEGGDKLQQTCKRGLTRFEKVVQFLEKVYPSLMLCFSQGEGAMRLIQGL